MKLPQTLKGKFIYYLDVPKTYKMYDCDPVQFKYNMEQLKKDLKEGEWDVPKPYNEFSNYNTIEKKHIDPSIKNNTYPRTLKGSGILVNDYDKTYSIPEGYRYNNKTKQALLKLRQDGYKRSNNTSRS
jgi:hypothetical protein